MSLNSIPRNLAGVIVFNQRIPLEGSNLGVEDSLHRKWKSSEQLVGAERQHERLVF